jgi:nitrogenase cofactor biosynthesis protein NifB
MLTLLEKKTKTHPCYNKDAKEYARIHLPVAPKCNISCNYCNRLYDCVNESRPGVTSGILTPEEALDRYKMVKERMNKLTVVGIAGPGDALANFEETKKTLELIKEYDPTVTFCLSTNGLNLPKYADELVELGVTHFTITMNTTRIDIAARIYDFVNYEGKIYRGEEGAKILLENQFKGLEMLAEKDVLVKVNTVLMKDINTQNIYTLMANIKMHGAFMSNIMPFIPVEGSKFENLPTVPKKQLDAVRSKAENTMKQMRHCKQCRSDAVGTLCNDVSGEINSGEFCSKHLKTGLNLA